MKNWHSPIQKIQDLWETFLLWLQLCNLGWTIVLLSIWFKVRIVMNILPWWVPLVSYSVESLILEHDQLHHFVSILYQHSWCICDTPDTTESDEDINLFAMVALWSRYILTFYTFYALASRFLNMADAMLLSLSLQTSNLWTMAFSVFAQDFSVSSLFLCSVTMIIFGVWLYEQGPSSNCHCLCCRNVL